MSQPPSNTGHVENTISSKATTALICGIVSIFFCPPIMGIIAIVFGNAALKLIEQYGVGQEHAGKAKAGKIIGIIMLVLFTLLILFYIALIVIAVGAGGMQGM